MNYRVCFAAYLRRHGRAESTVRIYVHTLDEFNKYNERSRSKPSNPASIRSSWEDVQRVRAQVHRDVINVRDRAIVELLYAGLTVRELGSLKYDRLWSLTPACLRWGSG
jgi:site-specific recombinase XerD